MHEHLEIIMPPTDNVEEAVKQIMKPFDENGFDDEYEEEGEKRPNKYGFWDFYVIGGRYAGSKLEADLDEVKLEAFYQSLRDNKITVSGFQAGKQEISPASQIPLVDKLWNEFFPDAETKVCPLFAHYNDQYKHSVGYPDIMKLADMPKSLKASHVIIASEGWQDDKRLEAKMMEQSSIWNGVTHIKSAWDGKVQTVIDKHRERLKDAQPDYAAKHVPTDDWLVVTVDYHS